MSSDLIKQLESQRRTIDAEHFDLTIRELLRMLEDGALIRAAEYQRESHWDSDTQSQFIESLFLGLPVPSLFVAANPGGPWEVIDGVQRLSALAHFATSRPGALAELGAREPLALTGLDRLTELNGKKLAELPPPVQRQLFQRTLRVTTLSDHGDPDSRFEMVRRLRSSGVAPLGQIATRASRDRRPPDRRPDRRPDRPRDRTTPVLKNARLASTLAAVAELLDVASREVRTAAAIEESTSADRLEQSAIRKASVYLYAAAALERACREGLHAVIAEINAYGAAPEHLRVSLFALHCAAELDAIGGGPRSLERMVRAAAMFETVFGAAHAPQGPVLPLDGRTPRAAHFATIWRVLGFPGVAVPDPACALALEELAEGRNDVAHGVRDAVAFGRSKAIADVAGVVGRAEQMIAHLFESADAYLDERRFLR